MLSTVAGRLFLVATPIGNLADLSARARETLAAADHILAEDTRRARVLLSHIGVPARPVSLHAHNEAARVEQAARWLACGEDVALISDAGTPLLSDPGERLVRRAIEEGCDVVPVPGPSAVLAALAASGLPCVPFTFLGFLPRKAGKRTRALERIIEARETTVLFESPARLVSLLEELAERARGAGAVGAAEAGAEGVAQAGVERAAGAGSGRRVAVCREMTKVHEEVVRGTPDEVADHYRERPPRGEVTVVVAGRGDDDSAVSPEAVEVLAREAVEAGMAPTAAAREVARRAGVPRGVAYEAVMRVRKGGGPLLLAAVLAVLPVVLPADAVAAQGSGPVTIARLQYDGGGDWYANPSSLPNLLAAVQERTGIPTADREVAVRPTDPSLRDYPFLYMTGHGNVRFTPDERLALRRYLLGGGFLHADDNYGLDESFREEIARIFPDRELVELPAEHPVFHAPYEFEDGLPKIHEHDGAPPQAFGIFHQGRLVVIYTYETDLGDGWEDPGVHEDPPAVREEALRMGVNIFVFAMTQAAS